jgi:hypothetical protein
MSEQRRVSWFASAAMAGLSLAAVPAEAREPGAFFTPVLTGNGGAFCGPCEPTPVLTSATPYATVVALRYRWSAAARGFELVSEEKAGVTDHQGELRFTVQQGEGSLDKLQVVVGRVPSDPFLFLTTGGCSGPYLCPLPRRLHALANASAYAPGGTVIATVRGAAAGAAVEVTQEEYIEEGEAPLWIPVSKPVTAVVDAHGHATALFEAPGPGVYRVIARDPESGDESSFSLYEVTDARR